MSKAPIVIKPSSLVHTPYLHSIQCSGICVGGICVCVYELCFADLDEQYICFDTCTRVLFCCVVVSLLYGCVIVVVAVAVAVDVDVAVLLVILDSVSSPAPVYTIVGDCMHRPNSHVVAAMTVGHPRCSCHRRRCRCHQLRSHHRLVRQPCRKGAKCASVCQRRLPLNRLLLLLPPPHPWLHPQLGLNPPRWPR
jgi:hypothetical protein